MNEAREKELLRHIPTLRSAGEVDGFSEQLKAQGEQMTTGILAALQAQMEMVK